MKYLKLKTLNWILAIIFITSCAPTKLTPETQSINGTENKLKKKANSLSSWEISGAIAARNSKKSWTASLNWIQRGMNQYQINLMGPLGNGAVLVERSGANVTFIDGNKKITSSNADELLYRQTGIRLPVNSLYYWVRGLPAPNTIKSAQYDANTNLIILNQSGYNINYTEYKTINNVNLPTKMQLNGNGLVIKIIIKQWKI